MLNNKIREIRRQAGLTQEQLAQLTDVRRETIIRLEKNLYNPSLELAFKIARVLDRDINVIFQYTGDITIEEPRKIEGQLEIVEPEMKGISQELYNYIQSIDYNEFLDLYLNSDNMMYKGEITQRELDFINLIDQCYDDTPVTIMSKKEEKDSYYKESIKQAVQLYKEIPNE